jgi:hypothetical protein
VKLNDEEQVIEGGEIREFGDYAYKVKEQRAKTTRMLAYFLLFVLVFSFVGHYGITTWLLLNNKEAIVESLNRIFNTWIPVISGFAGAAVTYFFTKEK